MLAAVGKDRANAGYQAAFPQGLTGLVGLRGKAQEAATFAMTAALRARFAELAERHGADLKDFAKTAAEVEDAWRAAERSAETAFVEERTARSELVRQLHSNRGALRALYPRHSRRVASDFPPSHSRAAEEPEIEEDQEP